MERTAVAICCMNIKQHAARHPITAPLRPAVQLPGWDGDIAGNRVKSLKISHFRNYRDRGPLVS
jgi:hypothetical protein